MIYWRVAPDMTFPNRWHLSAVADATGCRLPEWDFTEGVPATNTVPAEVLVSQDGVALDFDNTALDIYVVRSEIADILGQIDPGAIQRFPVRIAGRQESFEVLNIISKKECVDKTRSKIRYWSEEDCVRFPRLAGKYMSVQPLTVDPMLTDDAHIFRVARFCTSLIVSDTVRRALEAVEVTGIKFMPV